MGHPNKRYNFDGNTEDEHGGSYYVEDDGGERVAGPFASGPYATTVRERMADRWPNDLHVEYDH